MPPSVTQEQIVATIDALPVQGRIMLRLLLLQYLDVADEDIRYMATDRPDPRFHAGGKSATLHISQDTLQGIADRVGQYRMRARQRRERLKLQIDCLQKLVLLNETLAGLSVELLKTRFGVTPAALEEMRAQARTAVPKPVLRELNRKWDQEEIAEDDYRREALGLEYQRLLRKIEVDRKRLAQARREYELVNSTSLQDHEIAHIWGIPAGTLAARKAKFLHQYVQSLHAKLQAGGSAADAAQTPPMDLWNKTLAVLSQKPVERSPASYDGLETTEAILIEKLTAFATGRLPEEQDSRFWLSLIQDSRHQAEYGSKVVSLFALQRLSAILEEVDASPDALETELLNRTAPAAKALAAEPAEAAPTEAQLSELGEHVLRSFRGESHPDLQGRR